MKNIRLLPLLGLGLCLSAPTVAAQTTDAPATPTAPTPATELTGAQILEKSAAAYAALKSYKGTTAVILHSVIGVEGDKDMEAVQTATANFDFARDKSLCIEGRDTQGTPFTIQSEGAKTTLEWKNGASKIPTEQPSVELAIAAMTGVAATAPTLISAALMRFNWGYPFASVEGAQLQGRRQLDGFDCYQVVRPSAAAPGQETFWVDAQTFLLHQYKQEIGAMKFELPTEGLNAEQRAQFAKVQPKFTTIFAVFAIEAAS